MDLIERVDALEAAILALAVVELGEGDGHAFHGNQYTYIASYSEDHEAMQRGEYKQKKIRVQAEDEPTANLIAAQMVGRHGIPTETKLISTRLEAKVADHAGPTTLKPGDVIVDASKLGREEDDFSYLHGATIIKSVEKFGNGQTDFVNKYGQTSRAVLRGGWLTVDRPANG